jgi:hypothetical protein
MKEEGAAGLACAYGGEAALVTGSCVFLHPIRSTKYCTEYLELRCMDMKLVSMGTWAWLLPDESAPFPKVFPSGQYLHQYFAPRTYNRNVCNPCYWALLKIRCISATSSSRLLALVVL